MCWVLSAVSGCVGPNADKYTSVFVEDIEVKPFSGEYPTIVPREKGIVLNINTSIINEGEEDSSALSLHLRVEDADAHREVKATEVDIGYMKGRTLAYNTVPITVPGPGRYFVEAGVFEEGKDPGTSPILGMQIYVGADGEVEVI